MKIKIQLIEINQIEIYKLNKTSEGRVENLISELNVSFNKINNYIEEGICKEFIDKEVIDSFSRLSEIDRLCFWVVGRNSCGANFKLGVYLLESVIVILKTGEGGKSIRGKLRDFGFGLLDKIYSFEFDDLVNKSLLYQWLKCNNLIKYDNFQPRYGVCNNRLEDQIKFEPTGDELEKFFIQKKQNIFNYMVFEMSDGKKEIDPMEDLNARKFYHYHETLRRFSV